MLRDNMLDVLNDIWPMIFICSVILVITRLSYLFINKKELILYKELLMLACIIYMMCIFHIVTFQDTNFISDSNYIPFKEMLRYLPYRKLFIRNVVGNMIMFVPFGFFVTYFVKTNKMRVTFIITLITSLTIEITQKFIGRVFDIDDIILNVLGGTIGFLLYIFLYKTREKLPKILKNNIVYNIIIVSFITILILYLCGFSLEWIM